MRPPAVEADSAIPVEVESWEWQLAVSGSTLMLQGAELPACWQELLRVRIVLQRNT
jgi:hypothetical protein